MTYFFDIIIIVLLFAAFGYSHSLLASDRFKKYLVKSIGTKIAFYRLFYNVSSMLILVVIYYISPKPSLKIYDLVYPYDLIVYGLQILSVIGFLWSATFIDGGEFLGTSQIKRYFRGTYDTSELDERSRLVIRGPFKMVRHPLYLFSILFVGLRPVMNLFYLTFFICVALYFYIGSIYEERKLVERFGVQYEEYRKQVPRIFPIKLKM
ncbi:MAG: hypothetical protein SCALA702_27650 [Melioribacteraceae bacterium]|nr:MAG: hypothetical protein SCALA702_27650 [Melioribacteraceae bacterium]